MVADEAADVPIMLVAVTVKVYDVPLVRPLIVQLVDAVVQVNPPGVLVAVYEVTTEPPLLDGATQVTVALVEAAVAVAEVGAPGTVGNVAVTELEAGLDCPVALVTTAVKVYVVPGVRFCTSHSLDVPGVGLDTVQVASPGLAVTTRLVSDDPPVELDGVTITAASCRPP